MTTVINPTLPFSTSVENILGVGTIVQVHGSINDDKSFTINFKIEETDYALHFNPRFNENAVVMNTKKSGTWDKEERVPCAELQLGEQFDLLILVESDRYMINLNGKYFTHFTHRIDTQTVKNIDVRGNADIKLIRVGTAFTSEPIYNPTVPYTASIPGGFQKDKMIVVYGVPTGEQFSINLQCGQESFNNVALHLNPRITEGTIVLNSALNGEWEDEHVSDVALPANQPFLILIVSHGDVFEVIVNGKELAKFKNRHPDEHAEHLLDTLHIFGDLQIIMVHF